MKLEDVVEGRVYVDVNVFYMYLRSDPEHLDTLRSFFRRMVRGDITGYTAVLTMDELSYRPLLGRLRDASEGNPLDILRERGEDAVRTYAPEIETALRKLLRLPHLELAPVLPGDVPAMLRNVSAFGLLPRDALHVAVMARLDLDQIATDDRDFDRVPGTERHWLINEPESLFAGRQA